MTAKVNYKGDFAEIDSTEKDFIYEKVDKFADRYSSSLSDIHINLDCHRHKETSKGKSAFICKIKTSSGDGSFSSDNQDFGAGKTVVGALEKIERQIEKRPFKH